MIPPVTEPKWHEVNQRYLAQTLAAVRSALQAQAKRQGADDAGAETAPEAPSDDPTGKPMVLDRLCRLFQLSAFERDILLLCAGVELDGKFAALCAAAQGDSQKAYPTFSLALAALPEAHWSALAPTAPLRRYRLIEISPGPALTASPLRIDERILNCLVGVNHLDTRLQGIVDVVPGQGELVPSHQAPADQIAAVWRRATAPSPLPVIQLWGAAQSSKRGIAAAACRQIGFGLGVMAAESLPATPAELETLLELWEREALLTKSALLLECDDAGTNDAARNASVARLVERIPGILLLSTQDRLPMRQRPLVTFEIGKPTLPEQRQLWQRTLGAAAAQVNGHIEQLSAQFDITDQAIRAVSVEALGRFEAIPNATTPDLAATLWETCRAAARPRLDDLAHRIETLATWDDLVLPDSQMRILHDIAAHVRQRSTVYERWGFAAKGKRGLGIGALFAGTSGTGKTMAAEVLARALHLDLYRIDLSAVVSKYIGESEKNLRRVFDAAEEGGAILLFDEADALFGKRSEVKDSHDRYANQEVSYLLQRMESYRGLAILTTNLKSSLDVAFLRRLRYIVQFPFPDVAQRAEIWRRVFPAETPTESLAPEKLAQLNVAGGHIRNTALNAAFLAADAGEVVGMAHLLRAAQAEYAKLEKTLTEAEVAGWV